MEIKRRKRKKKTCICIPNSIKKTMGRKEEKAPVLLKTGKTRTCWMPAAN